jgi:hypothetical protein
MDTRLLIIIVVAAVAVAAVAWWYVQTRRREHLRARFGPEYERAVREAGDQTKAEAMLTHRERRIAKLKIRALEPEESSRFREAWRRVQARFVDDPKGAVTEADRLITEVMSARGYPMTDWEQRVADISVDHPRVCEHYRQGHDIALRHERGEASTEDLRQAMMHYRDLFAELVEPAREHAVDHKAERRAG